eukprot:gene32236-38991_t
MPPRSRSMWLIVVLISVVCTWAEPRWDAEIDRSLRANIIGGCKVNRDVMAHDSVSMKQVESSNELLAQILYPSKLDVKHMRQLPMSLTLADKDLADNARRWDYTHEKWHTTNLLRWEVPASHPGQDRNNCLNMTFLAATEHVIAYYETFKNIKRAFYVIHGRHAFVHPSGAVAFSCGYYMGHEACENRWNYAENWYKPCKALMDKNSFEWRQLFDKTGTANMTNYILKDGCSDRTDLGSPDKHTFNITRHSKVFTIPALWDYNYHHWIADSLARLAHNLRFLRANPDVMIHVRSFEEYDGQRNKDQRFKDGSKKMRLEFFDLLGIARNRIVTGPILADEVYIPRFLRCSYLLSNPVELQLLAKHILTAAHTELGLKMDKLIVRAHVSHKPHPGNPQNPTAPPKNKTLIIQQRFTKFGSNYREWNDVTLEPVVAAFKQKFPEHNVVVISSKDLKTRSLAKEVLMYNSADVLVGLHGAGLTNMMFMPPNSLIVEFVGRLVDVHMPVCGYYGPMGAAFGHHHYLHSYDVNEKEATDTRAEQGADRAAKFYKLIHGPKANTPILQVYNSLKVENQ